MIVEALLSKLLITHWNYYKRIVKNFLLLIVCKQFFLASQSSIFLSFFFFHSGHTMKIFGNNSSSIQRQGHDGHLSVYWPLN